MSGRKFAAIVGVALSIQASVLWWLNGWNATHAIFYGIGIALVIGAVIAPMFSSDE